jgi:predicted permease
VRTDLKIWLRQVRKAPGRFVAAVLSLGLGIGAVTAAHAIIDITLLRPVRGISETGLVAARQGEDRSDLGEYQFRASEVLSERQELFSSVATFGALSPDYPVAAGGSTARAVTLMVSAEYFHLLGVQIAAGRPFTAADHRVDAPVAVILSDAFWRSRFSGDLAAVGREIRIGDVPATVVGIVPSEFRGTDVSRRPDVYVPIELTPRINPIGRDWLGDHSPMWVQIIARLRPGVSKDMASAALATRAEAEQDWKRHAVGAVTRLIDLQRAAVPRLMWKEFDTLVSLYSYAAASVFLIACLTVGTLLLVQGEERRQDLAIRLALGATRGRLIVGSWIQGLVPATFGGVLGLPVAYGILQSFGAFTPRSGVIFTHLGMPFNSRVLMGAGTAVLVVSAIVAAISCRVTLGASIADTLRSGLAPSMMTRRHARRVLVLVQVASSMALLVGALLLARSMSAVYAIDLGYPLNGLVEATVDMMAVRISEADRRTLYQTIDSQLHASLPSAQLGRSELEWVAVDGLDQIDPNATTFAGSGHGRSVHIRTVAPGYLEALAIPVIEGRAFVERDVVEEQAPAVISAKLARLLSPNGSALGIRLDLSVGQGRPVVIGVVNDIRSDPLFPSRPTAYVLTGTLPEGWSTSPVWFLPNRTPRLATFTIRTPDVPTVTRIVRNAVGPWPAATVSIVTTPERIARAVSAQRLAVAAIGPLSVTAILLAMLSLFVLITSTITARMRELGIRMSLGATPGNLFALLLGDTLLVVVAGLLLGTVVMLNGAHVLRSLLFGVRATDPSSFLGAAILLFLVSLIVLSGPVLRASRLTPSRILRHS